MHDISHHDLRVNSFVHLSFILSFALSTPPIDIDLLSARRREGHASSQESLGNNRSKVNEFNEENDNEGGDSGVPKERHNRMQPL